MRTEVKGLTASRAVEKCRERIYSTLEEHCKRVHPDEPARFAKLLLRLPSLRSIGLKCLEHLFFAKLLGDRPVDSFLMEVLNAALTAHDSPMDDSSTALLAPMPTPSLSLSFPAAPQFLSSQSQFQSQSSPGAALCSASSVNVSTNGSSSSSTAASNGSGAFSLIGAASHSPVNIFQQQPSFLSQSAQLLASPTSGGFTFPTPGFSADPSIAHGIDQSNLNPFGPLSASLTTSGASLSGMQTTANSTHTTQWTRPF